MEVKSFETSILKGWASTIVAEIKRKLYFFGGKIDTYINIVVSLFTYFARINSKKKFLVKGGFLSPTPCAFHEQINHIRVNRSQWNIKQRETYTHCAPVLVSDSYSLQRSRCLVVSNGSSVAGTHHKLMLRYFFKCYFISLGKSNLHQS